MVWREPRRVWSLLDVWVAVSPCSCRLGLKFEKPWMDGGPEPPERWKVAQGL